MGTYKILCLFVLWLIILSCARQQKVTETRLVLGNIASMAFSDGGVLLVGEGPFGTFSKNISDANLTYTLATGTWRFRVVAWSGPNPLEGTLRCEDFVVTLTKSSESVALFLNESKCAGLGFGGAAVRIGGTNLFKPLTVHTCADLAQDINGVGLNGFVPGMICDDYRGRERSFRIAYPPKDTPGTAGHVTPPLASICITGMGGSSASIASSVRIPNFGPQVPVKVIAYDQAGCSGIERHFMFDQGLTTTSFLNDAFPFYGASVGDIYLDSMLCAGSWLTNVPFAQGAHDASGPNYICNQLHLSSLSVVGANYNVSHMAASSSYQLAANIDLTAYAFSIGGTAADAFKGIFDGRGRTLSNGTVGVFSVVGDGAQIVNLNLDNFYSTVSGNGLGLLINTVENVTASTPVYISSVTIKNSIRFNSGVFSNFGSVIGYTEWPVELDHILIENVDLGITGTSNASLVVGNISNSSAAIQNRISKIKIIDSSVDGNNATGGVVGLLTVSDDPTYQTYVEYSEVLNTRISGLDGVGSIIGKATAVSDGSLIMTDHYVQGPVLSETLAGDNYIGGIIGLADTNVDLEINDSYFGGRIDVLTANGYGFGGIVGDSSIVRIFNSSAVVDIFDLSGGPSTNIGGIIGRMGNTASGTSSFVNNYADIYFDLDEAHVVGGLAGLVLGVSGTVTNIVSSSMAAGLISTTDAPGNSSYIGGLIGTIQNATVEKSISHVNLGGVSNIGGAIGKGDSVSLSEIYVTGAVNFRGGGSAANNGGIVGIMDAFSGFDSSIVNVAFAGSITDTTCLGGDCGVIIGRALNAGNSTLCPSSTLYAAVAGYASLNGIGVTNGNCTAPDVNAGVVTPTILAFTSEHIILNPALNVAGTTHFPLIIDTIVEWNNTADKPYLLDKALALGAHLDFNAQILIPFGGTSVSPFPFKGKLIPNGYTLSNITIDADLRCGVNAGNADCGIFRQVGNPVVSGNMARVGNWDDPLIINGLIIDWNNGSTTGDRIGGVAGIVFNASIAARVNNGTITINNSNAPTSFGFGGLVGVLSDNASIESSSYIGTIEVNGTNQQDIGGLVGLAEMQNADKYASITSSRAIVNFLGNGIDRGGLVGYASLTASNASLYVDSVYVKIDGMAVNSTNDGGLFGRFNNTPSGTLDMHNAIAIFDTTDAADGVVGTVVGGTFPDDADSSIVVINLQGTHANETFAATFTSWPLFLASGNYDIIFNPYNHDLYHDPNFQYPRFVWQYPVGTYPNIPY